MKALVVAYAKLNLSLAVFGRRPDGFHDIDSVVQTIDLSDRLSIDVRSGDSIDVRNSLADIAGPDLAAVAAASLLQAKGIRRAVSIDIDKAIPAGAGLGGGSSDAASVLATLDRLTPPRLSAQEMAVAATRIGSDVALFLTGGRLRVTGRGESATRLPGADEHYAVVIPTVRCATPEVYAVWDSLRAREAPVGDPLGRNDLEAAALALHPELRSVRDAVARCGARYAGMSGSGSAFFAAFTRRCEAEAAAGRLKELLPACEVLVAGPTAVGWRLEGGEAA